MKTALIFFLLSCLPLPAATVNGTVRSVEGEIVQLKVEGEMMPPFSAPAEIYFKLAGSDEEISVATARVETVSGESVQLKIENATGEVARDQLVRIRFDRAEAKPVATPVAATATPPPATTAYRSEVQMIATHVFTFDELSLGPLADDAFAGGGLRFRKGKGEPAIYALGSNMLAPWPHQKVLLVGGGPVTALSVLLDPPVKHFAMYRVGASNGASTPTWKMTAYNSGGKAVGRAGEEHKIAPAGASFSIEAGEITRVEITTDNRNGKGTWATWNSLPIVGVGFDR